MVVEHALHHRLAVVEGAVDRERMHVVVVAPSSSCGAARRRCGPSGRARRRRRARGRGRPRPPRRRCRPRWPRRWSCARRALASTWSISRARSCIATSLKASVGPWNSSSMKVPGAELRERRDGRMAERVVGFARHAGEIGRRDRVAGEPADHVGGDLRVGPAGEPCDLVGDRAAAKSRAHRARRRGRGPPASHRRSRASGRRRGSRRNARLLNPCSQNGKRYDRRAARSRGRPCRLR